MPEVWQLSLKLKLASFFLEELALVLSLRAYPMANGPPPQLSLPPVPAWAARLALKSLTLFLF